MHKRKFCRKLTSPTWACFCFCFFFLKIAFHNTRSHKHADENMPIYGVRYMDFVFGNETEARTFSKVHGWEVIVTW